MPKSIPVSEHHLSIDEIEHSMDCLANKLNAGEFEFLLLIREFDERGGWIRSGSRNCAQWLEWRFDLSASAAREKVRVAAALKDLSLISGAFSKGALAYSKVRALTRVATVENEAELLEMAGRLTAAQVDQYCRQKRNASPESTALARRAQSQRGYRSWPDHERGMVTITVELPTEEAALFEKAVEKAVQAFGDSSTGLSAGPDDDTSWGAVQADAVVNMAKQYLSPVSPAVPGSSESIDSAEFAPGKAWRRRKIYAQEVS